MCRGTPWWIFIIVEPSCSVEAFSGVVLQEINKISCNMTNKNDYNFWMPMLSSFFKESNSAFCFPIWTHLGYLQSHCSSNGTSSADCWINYFNTIYDQSGSPHIGLGSYFGHLLGWHDDENNQTECVFFSFVLLVLISIK
jgi:hypothetical protein